MYISSEISKCYSKSVFDIILRTGYRTLWNSNVFHVKENSGPFRFLPVILV